MTNSKAYRDIQEFFATRGIHPVLVDLYADSTILRLHVSGASVSDISEMSDVNEESVRNILESVFGGVLFEKTLDKNPLMVYNRCSGNVSCFLNDIDDIKLYSACYLYNFIYGLLDKIF